MNIKEIAQKLAPDHRKRDLRYIRYFDSVGFAEALIAEIAKQNEPVAWMHPEEGLSYENHYTGNIPLYTFPPTAEQIARIAELEAENATITERNNINEEYASNLVHELTKTQEQVLLAQAEIKRLRDALSKCSEQLTRLGYSANHADQALAQPSDTSALDVYQSIAENLRIFSS